MERERMEYLRHMQVLLEQACEHFQVFYIAPNVFFLALSKSAAEEASVEAGHAMCRHDDACRCPA